MPEMKYTLGPWYKEAGTSDRWGIFSEHDNIAIAWTVDLDELREEGIDRSPETALAHACVLEAAPDLLEACKPCLQDYTIVWSEGDGEVSSCNPVDYGRGERFEVYLSREQMDIIKAAIAKAEPKE